MPQDLKFQIFISSTFEDLADERRAVIEQILNLQSIPVGMELFQAGDDDQWSYIKRRILECDYYIVVVAERYGSTNKEGQSYAEMEYRFAVENSIPVAGFLLDDAARNNWPKGKIEFDKMAEINAFRELCKRKMIKYWENEHDLAAKVGACLAEMFRSIPRTGWVRADRAVSSAVTNELARLSEENAKLRHELSTAQRDDSRVRDCVLALEGLSVREMLQQAFPKYIQGSLETIELDELISGCADGTLDANVLTIIINHYEHFVRGVEVSSFSYDLSMFILGNPKPQQPVEKSHQDRLGGLARFMAADLIYKLNLLDVVEKHDRVGLIGNRAEVWEFSEFGRKVILSSMEPRRLLRL